MKLGKPILLSILLAINFNTYAADAGGEDYTENPNPPSAGEDKTAQYLKVLGEYLGYPLDTETSPIHDMLSYTLSLYSGGIGQQNLNTLIASIPVNNLFPSLVSNAEPYDSFINPQASSNTIYKDYANTKNSLGLSVIENVDQKPYQNDPVSQVLLNMVGTPDWSICSAYDTANKDSESSSPCMSQTSVMMTVLNDVVDSSGQLPPDISYFTAENNQKFLSQLNSNNLVAPMLYSKESSNNQKGSSLPGATQIQQATDFIRYATGSVLPFDMMTQTDYSTLRNLAASKDDATKALNAQQGLAKYLLSLRVYAAKNSVAAANLYEMLSRRVPQTSDSSNGSATATSQAMNEFQMATWRLYNPNNKQQSSEQWVQKISTASPATIQKEIAVLLSEINYQLYLSRQQQERLLLTNSLILIETLAKNPPDPDIPSNVDTGDTNQSTAE